MLEIKFQPCDQPVYIRAMAIRVALVLMTGCSVAMVQRVPDGWTVRDDPNCTSSVGPVIGDGIIAAVGLGIAAAAAESDPASNMVLVGALPALIFAISGAVGQSWIATCRSAETLHHLDEIALDVGGSRPRRAQVSGRKAINPTDDPKEAWAYWCSTQSGLCSADEARCTGSCSRVRAVHCAVYSEEGKGAFVCGASRHSCLVLVGKLGNKYDLGECVAQKPQLPQPAITAKRNAEAKPAAEAEPAVTDPNDIEPTENETPKSTAPPGFLCTSSRSVPTAGFCSREWSVCDRMQAEMVRAGGDAATCAAASVAMCFSYQEVNGASATICAPSTVSCAATRDGVLAKSPPPINAETCTETR